MRNKHITEINVYHTPDKGSKPDLKNQSHLKTTVPSVFQTSESKAPSQFGIHHNKKQTYEFGSGTPQLYSDKRASKNQWQLKEKVDEYQTQIGLLRQYLRGCHCGCIQKNSISRIFGFSQDRNRLQNQQQRVIKELGSKVKSLIKQNSSLKYQNVHYSQLNIEQIIQQNNKLQMLLQQYKVNDSFNNKRLFEQNQILKDEIYQLRLKFEEKIKLIQIEHDGKIGYLEANEHGLLKKIQLLQRQNEQNLKKSALTNEKLSHSKLRQIEEVNARLIKQTQAVWRKKLEDQQNYYQRVKDQWETSHKQYASRLHGQQLKQVKKHYLDLIHTIEIKQMKKFAKLQTDLYQMQRRIEQTNESIAHFKFERANRLQSTIRKSVNIAASSYKPKGQQSEQQPVPEQLQPNQNIVINTKPLSYSVNTVHMINSPKSQILLQKIEYLQKQIAQLKTKLNISEKIIAQKTDRIINLENEIRNLNITLHNMNLRLNEARQTTIVKEVIKQVPVTIPVIPKDYSQEVKNIKQTIISCNISNFDVFQSEFNEIIEQRNQMNQKIVSLKKQAKQSNKILILQKHIKVERQRNHQLEQNIKRYEKEIENLRIQVIELQNQLETIHATEIVNDAQSINKMSGQTLPDGKAGLEWQKVVKHCLMTSINRLQSLQNNMKQDLLKSK